MHPAKRQRRRKNRHIARAETVDGVLIAVEADEFFIVGHIDLSLKLVLQRLVARVQSILEHIGPICSVWSAKAVQEAWKRLDEAAGKATTA